MNFPVRRSLPPGALDVFRLHILAAALHFAGNSQQGFELIGNGGLLEIAFDLLDEFFIAPKVMGGDCAVTRLAVIAVVPGRNVGGDQFPLTRRKRAFVMQ